MRDSQKSKLYRAERELLTRSPRLESEAELRRFVADVFNDSRVQRHCVWASGRWATESVGSTAVHVRRHGNLRAHAALANARKRELVFQHGGVRRYVVLHEAAHLLRLRGLSMGASHGREFAKTLLQLVAWFDGADEATHLRARFVAWKVKHRAKPRYSSAALRELEERGRALAREQWGSTERKA